MAHLPPGGSDCPAARDSYPDTTRLRHIAWLGHSTLPYAFGLAGKPVQEVHCELGAPDGTTWTFGPSNADSSIVGPAAAFCRVGAQRLAPEDSGLLTQGPCATEALSLDPPTILVRTF